MKALAASRSTDPALLLCPGNYDRVRIYELAVLNGKGGGGGLEQRMLVVRDNAGAIVSPPLPLYSTP